jgi:hypothetical protein
VLAENQSVSVFSAVQHSRLPRLKRHGPPLLPSKQTVASSNVESRVMKRYGSFPAYGAVFVESGAMWSKCSCLRTISRILSESFIGPSSAAS